MFRKNKHTWYWHSLWALLFCYILFSIAKVFMKEVSKKGEMGKKKGDTSYNFENLFV